MRFVSRHPIGISLLAFSVVFGGAGLWLSSAPARVYALPAAARPAAAMRQAEGPEPLDPVSATELATLRRDLGLNDNALCVMNLSDEELDTVLGGLRSWFDENRGQWESVKSAIADEKALIRHYRSEIGQGHDESENLTTAKAALVELESGYATLLAGAKSMLLAGLSENQTTALATLSANTDQPMPYAALALSNQEKGALTKARIQYQNRISATTDREKAATFASDFESAVASAVGGNNVTALQNLAAVLGPASVRVEAAIRRNLPVTE